MLRKIICPVIIVLLLSVLITFSTQATTQSTYHPSIQPSNYCVSCHSTGDTRIDNPTAWIGGIEHNQVSPCPAVTQISEELYYTERLMLAIDRAHSQAPSSADLSKISSRLTAASQNYSRLLDTPVTSLEAFTSEAKIVRFQLGKSYSAISQTIEAAKRARVLWAAVGVSVAITVSLVWGWVNAQKALHTPQTASAKRFGFYIPRVIILLFIFGFFALPIFRLPSQAVAMPSAEEQENQAVLDETGRAALTADRELSRAWMLAQIGATMAHQNPAQGDTILEEALTAAQEAQNNTSALWGLSQLAWEAGSADGASMADAALVASDLAAVQGRAWALRLIAETWIDIDASQAETILEGALAQTEAAPYPYAQLDLRAIAVTWVQFDPERGVAIARRIVDPALRSWAFREIAVITGDANHFDAAAEAARLVNDPIEQARVLREVGASSGNTILFDEAAAALKQVDGTAQAYALADLAAASGNPSLVAQIAPEFPSAQALAYFSLGDYKNAWQAAAEISDPFKQARAQAAIAAAWQNTEAAVQITSPLLRDRALRDISLKTGNLTLVEMMQDSYYQVQVLTAAGRFEDAWQIVEGLGDRYPLVALGTAWSADDPQDAAQVLDALTREADKAIVLRSIATATGQQEDFETALGMALAARIRGDALSPVQASLDLAEASAADYANFKAALLQAYDAAQKINIIY